MPPDGQAGYVYEQMCTNPKFFNVLIKYM